MACFSVGSAHALKETPIGKFDLSVKGSAEYDSRVFGVPSATFRQATGATSDSPGKDELESESDMILRFTPAVHYSKKLRWFTFSGTAGLNAVQYLQNADKSHADPITRFTVDFDESLKKRISNDAKIRFDMNFDLGQRTETSMLEQDLVSYSYFLVGLNMRYNHSPKFGVGAGASYSARWYQESPNTFDKNIYYDDITSMPVHARAFYIYSEKLDFFTEYSYVPTNSASSRLTSQIIDGASHTFSIGVQGDLTPKLSGDFKLGHVTRNFDEATQPSQSSLSLGANLKWTLNRKTGVDLSLSRDFTPSPQGYSMLSTNLRTTLRHRFTENLLGTGQLTYGTADYTTPPPLGGGGRTMDQFGFGLGLQRQINKRWSSGASYDYSHFVSEQSSGSESYGRHLLRVDVGARF